MSVRRLNIMDENAAIRISGSLTYAATVFNNKTFEMRQTPTESKAFAVSFQILQIDCGENIKLHRQCTVRMRTQIICLSDTS